MFRPTHVCLKDHVLKSFSKWNLKAVNEGMIWSGPFFKCLNVELSCLIWTSLKHGHLLQSSGFPVVAAWRTVLPTVCMSLCLGQLL